MEIKTEPTEQLKKLIIFFEIIEKEKYWGEISLTFNNGKYIFHKLLQTGQNFEKLKIILDK